MFFHFGMWEERRTIRAQEYDENLRALRAAESIEHGNVILAPYEKDLDRFIIGKVGFTILHYGNWLPPNWEGTTTSIHSTAHIQSLVGLPKSVFPQAGWAEFTDPAGGPAGWEYHTNGERLGLPEAAKEWMESGSVSGSLMFPQSGEIEISCEGSVLSVQSPVQSATAENRGLFRVLRGLNRLTISRSTPSQPPPLYLHLVFRPSGQGMVEEHTLSPADLYTIPVHGWFRKIERNGQSQLEDLSVTPTIFTHHIKEEFLSVANGHSVTKYQAIAHLPPGPHQFVIDMNEPRSIVVRIADGRVLIDGKSLDRTYSVTLEASEVNGKGIEIMRTDQDHPAAISLETIDGAGRREVPPYHWLEPVALAE
jgi:hypothetical protein